ncbi:MAG: hypothetical protein ACREJ3_10205, partial [Polyangiaceae bacterium]
CCTPEPTATWCANRCGSVLDSCWQPMTCPGCSMGLTCTSGACGCVPDPVSTTCNGKSCGTATNNCGQAVSCGSGGTVDCASSSEVCLGATCCTPDNVTACAGKCNTTVMNNCNQMVACSATCPSAGVCLSDNTCCAPDNTTACSGLGCGSATNNCGQSITCPDTCTPPATCGGGTGGANACGCTDNGAACSGRCGGTATNNCGVVVTCATKTCSGTADVCNGGVCMCGTLPACPNFAPECCHPALSTTRCIPVNEICK